MKIRKLEVSFSRTVSPRKFRPVTVTTTLGGDLEEGDDRKTERQRLYRENKAFVDRSCERILEEEYHKEHSEGIGIKD